MVHLLNRIFINLVPEKIYQLFQVFYCFFSWLNDCCTFLGNIISSLTRLIFVFSDVLLALLFVSLIWLISIRNYIVSFGFYQYFGSDFNSENKVSRMWAVLELLCQVYPIGCVYNRRVILSFDRIGIGGHDFYDWLIYRNTTKT